MARLILCLGIIATLPGCSKDELLGGAAGAGAGALTDGVTGAAVGAGVGAGAGYLIDKAKK
jgi:hypothetical protein